MQSPLPIAAPSPHLAVRPDWLDLRREEIIEPDLPIVDPHHHLVERPETGRYLLPELLADTSDGHNITATVYLESEELRPSTYSEVCAAAAVRSEIMRRSW
jgi:hypothetical protein